MIDVAKAGRVLRGFFASITPNGWLLGVAIVLATAGMVVTVLSANNIFDEARERASARAEGGAG